jgi:hypothetical protein
LVELLERVLNRWWPTSPKRRLYADIYGQPAEPRHHKVLVCDPVAGIRPIAIFKPAGIRSSADVDMMDFLSTNCARRAPTCRPITGC